MVNTLSYIDNQFIMNRCVAPLDLNIMLDLHKFNLAVIIDHHGFLCIVAIILPLSIVARKQFIITMTNIQYMI